MQFTSPSNRDKIVNTFIDSYMNNGGSSKLERSFITGIINSAIDETSKVTFYEEFNTENFAVFLTELRYQISYLTDEFWTNEGIEGFFSTLINDYYLANTVKFTDSEFKNIYFSIDDISSKIIPVVSDNYENIVDNFAKSNFINNKLIFTDNKDIETKDINITKNQKPDVVMGIIDSLLGSYCPPDLFDTLMTRFIEEGILEARFIEKESRRYIEYYRELEVPLSIFANGSNAPSIEEALKEGVFVKADNSISLKLQNDIMNIIRSASIKSESNHFIVVGFNGISDKYIGSNLFGENSKILGFLKSSKPVDVCSPLAISDEAPSVRSINCSSYYVYGNSLLNAESNSISLEIMVETNSISCKEQFILSEIDSLGLNYIFDVVEEKNLDDIGSLMKSKGYDLDYHLHELEKLFNERTETLKKIQERHKNGFAA